MYCIKCGVELDDGIEKCPLCGTYVCHPDFAGVTAERSFPKPEIKKEEFKRQGVLFVLTFIFLIPLLLTLVIDLTINGTMVWSGYPVGAIILAYILLVLPFWIKRPNPVVFVPIDFAAIAAYLCYINFITEGNWFLTLALPINAVAALTFTLTIALCKYIGRRAYLFVFGGALIVTGVSTIGTELLINYTFGFDRGIVWSAYPLIVFSMIGIMLIIIGVCRPLRESLRRRFFI